MQVSGTKNILSSELVNLMTMCTFEHVYKVITSGYRAEKLVWPWEKMAPQ